MQNKLEIYFQEELVNYEKLIEKFDSFMEFHEERFEYLQKEIENANLMFLNKSEQNEIDNMIDYFEQKDTVCYQQEAILYEYINEISTKLLSIHQQKKSFQKEISKEELWKDNQKNMMTLYFDRQNKYVQFEEQIKKINQLLKQRKELILKNGQALKISQNLQKWENIVLVIRNLFSNHQENLSQCENNYSSLKKYDDFDKTQKTEHKQLENHQSNVNDLIQKMDYMEKRLEKKATPLSGNSQKTYIQTSLTINGDNSVEQLLSKIDQQNKQIITLKNEYTHAIDEKMEFKEKLLIAEQQLKNQKFEFQNEKDELVAQINKYKRELEKYKGEMEIKQRKEELLESQFSLMEKKLQAIYKEQRTAEQEIEMNKNQDLYNNKWKEEYEKLFKQAQGWKQDLLEKENEFERLKLSSDKFDKIISTKDYEYKRLLETFDKTFQEYRTKVETKDRQIDDLEIERVRMESQIQSLTKKVEEYKKEIDFLKKNLQHQKNQIGNFENKYDEEFFDLQNQLQKQKDDFWEQKKKLMQEIESLNQKVKDFNLEILQKNQEIENLTFDIKRIKDNNNNENGKFEELNLIIKDQLNQIQELNKIQRTMKFDKEQALNQKDGVIQNLQNVINQYETKIKNQNKELSKIEKSISSSNIGYRNQIGELVQTNLDLEKDKQSKEIIIENQQKEIKELKEELRNKLNTLNRESQKYSLKNDELMSERQKLFVKSDQLLEENKNLKNLLQGTEIKLSDLSNQYKLIKKQLNEKEAQYEILMNKMNEHQNRLQSINQEKESVLQKSQNIEQEKQRQIYELNQDLEYYKEKYDQLALSAKQRLNTIAEEKEQLKEKLKEYEMAFEKEQENKEVLNKELQIKILELQKQEFLKKDNQSMQEEIDYYQKQISDLNKIILNFQNTNNLSSSQLQNTQGDLDVEKEKVRNYQLQIVKLEGERDNLLERIQDTNNNEIKNLQKENKKLSDVIEQLRQKLQEEKSKLDSTLKLLHLKEDEISRLQQQYDKTISNKNEWHSQSKDLKSQVDELTFQLKKCQIDKDDLLRRIRELEEQVRGLEEENSSIRKNLQNVMNKNLELTVQRDDIEQQFKEKLRQFSKQQIKLFILYTELERWNQKTFQ